VDGVTLTFHLAGINNQNFLMRDEETGTYWQQISGLAISGPLTGRSLLLIHCDELTFALWKTEQPRGTVFKDVAAYTAQYSGSAEAAMSVIALVLRAACPVLMSATGWWSVRYTNCQWVQVKRCCGMPGV
jgi:hypothetical protein